MYRSHALKTYSSTQNLPATSFCCSITSHSFCLASHRQTYVTFMQGFEQKKGLHSTSTTFFSIQNSQYIPCPAHLIPDFVFHHIKMCQCFILCLLFIEEMTTKENIWPQFSLIKYIPQNNPCVPQQILFDALIPKHTWLLITFITQLPLLFSL